MTARSSNGGHRGVQGLGFRHQDLPSRWCQRQHAAGGEVEVASLATLAGDQQLVDARKPLALLDLVDLCVIQDHGLIAPGGRPYAKGLVPKTGVRPPGGATTGMKLVEAKPINPASAASLA
jgi:hypothetical protein